MLKTCNCVSLVQDTLYGKGMRVHTVSKKGDEIRCTVCKPRRLKIRLNSHANPPGGVPDACLRPSSKTKIKKDFSGRSYYEVAA